MKELNCHTAYEWIVRDLDEGLEPEKLPDLDRHLRHCPDCRRLREETAALLSRLPEDVPPEPDDEFWSRYHSSLRARLQEKALSERPFWSFHWKGAATMLSALAVLLVAVWGPFLSRTPEKWQQNAAYPAVIQELSEVYGPVPDEMASGPVSSDRVFMTVDSRASALADDLFAWFDIDDETNAFSF
jgi:hypothetical protein